MVRRVCEARLFQSRREMSEMENVNSFPFLSFSLRPVSSLLWFNRPTHIELMKRLPKQAEADPVKLMTAKRRLRASLCGLGVSLWYVFGVIDFIAGMRVPFLNSL